jgi:hypothetical protein
MLDNPFTFYIGTNKGHWTGFVDAPLFISNRTLRKRRTFHRAVHPWALDSGGFTELLINGKWTVTPQVYAEAVRRYQNEVGLMDFASQQDWMCEDHMLKRTGLTVRQHQQLTVDNLLELRNIDSTLPIIPVLQGQTTDDYLHHIEMFENAGIKLREEPRVGLGSVCRRQRTLEIIEVVSTIQQQHPMKLHGFGVKTLGLQRIHHLLTSADSMAWSITARWENIKLEQCTHRAPKCADCHIWALQWRQKVLQTIKGDNNNGQ